MILQIASGSSKISIYNENGLWWQSGWKKVLRQGLRRSGKIRLYVSWRNVRLAKFMHGVERTKFFMQPVFIPLTALLHNYFLQLLKLTLKVATSVST
jgi:hypothetical protein